MIMIVIVVIYYHEYVLYLGVLLETVSADGECKYPVQGYVYLLFFFDLLPVLNN